MRKLYQKKPLTQFNEILKSKFSINLYKKIYFWLIAKTFFKNTIDKTKSLANNKFEISFIQIYGNFTFLKLR